MQRGFDVVCRSAVGASVRILLLVDLRKAGLHETGSTAEKGDHPHPEQSAGAAKADGSGDADDVSGTDAGRGGDHQCAEGRNITLVLRLFQDHAPCLFEHSELHEFRADREIDSAGDQKRDQRPSPKETGNGIDDRHYHKFYPLFLIAPAAGRNDPRKTAIGSIILYLSPCIR